MAEQKTPTSPTATKPKPAASPKEKTKQLPPYNVILLNDEEHSYDYVVHMLKSLFGHTDEKGYQLAKTVDTQGRAIVLTTHKEKAELKRDQIQAFGADHRIDACKGSMSAEIEPAES
jgi:ATP-dependent Clp protease adaptor protein ClpS